jgi:tyrosine-protein phosphatase SIW14
MGRRILSLPMRNLFFYVTSTLLFLPGPVQAQTQCGQPITHSQQVVSSSRLKGVPDFHEVTPKFYRGGEPSRTGFENLREKGVAMVIDLRGNRASERKEVTRLGMEYVAIPWHCPFPHDATFAKFLTLMRANSNRKVFVHCRLGDDRVGMMVAAYRMAEQGWTAEQAMQEMKSSGFTRSHHIICPGLASYERHFPEHYRTSPAFAALREEKSPQ